MIGITYSESHPLPRALFREEMESLGDYKVKEIEVPAGGVDQPADDILTDAVANCEALFVRPGVISRAVFEAAPDLEAIQTIGSGYDHVDVEAATDYGVVVSHNPEAPNEAVAEHTLGLMVALVRDLPRRVQECANGDWMAARSPKFHEIGACTVGVVGLGSIGQEVAERVEASFGSELLGYDPYVGPEDVDTDIELIDDLADVFERSDLVTLHTPLTKETKHMISTEEFEALESGYFINTCRGGVVDEDALIETIGELEGAALDVFENEPPASDHPLLAEPNVQVTPHIAGASNQTMERGVHLAAEKIDSMLHGGRPDTVVNPAVFD